MQCSVAEYNFIRQMLDKQNQDTANDDILLNDVVADETTSYVGSGQSSEHKESAAAPTTTRYQFSTGDEMQEFLIVEVQAHESIWNRQSPLHKIPLETKMAWKDIANNLGQSGK